MGDFNTLSRHDEAQHRDARLADMLRRNDESVRVGLMHGAVTVVVGVIPHTPIMLSSNIFATLVPLCCCSQLTQTSKLNLSWSAQQLFGRLRKKYLDEANPATGGIQYAPMDILLR